MAVRGHYGKWSQEEMDQALKAYRNGKMGLNAASKTYRVPKATLIRHMKGTNVNAVGVRCFGRSIDLPWEIEEDLTRHVLLLRERLFDLRKRDLRRFAFEMAEANRIPHRFNRKQRMAGDKWYHNFVRRHPEITNLRRHESEAPMQATGFKARLKEFFEVLKNLVYENNFDGSDLYTVGETTLPNVKPNCRPICCMSAGGVFVPPMLVFEKTSHSETVDRHNRFMIASSRTKFAISNDGSITGDVFLSWLKHFIETVKPTRDKCVLLLLDGQAAYVKNIHVLQLAADHGVILLSFPPRTKYCLLPLARRFFHLLSAQFMQALENRGEANGSEVKLDVHEICNMFKEVYEVLATAEIAVDGFRTCGIWPTVDGDAFVENSDYDASKDDGNNEYPQDMPSNDDDSCDDDAASTASNSGAEDVPANGVGIKRHRQYQEASAESQSSSAIKITKIMSSKVIKGDKDKQGQDRPSSLMSETKTRPISEQIAGLSAAASDSDSANASIETSRQCYDYWNAVMKIINDIAPSTKLSIRKVPKLQS